MLEIADCVAPQARAAVGVATSGRARFYANRARNQIVTVSMPVRCPEEDPHCTEYRDVSLHIKDRRTVWLAIEDVQWAVQYMLGQYRLRGVAVVADDDEGPAKRPVAVNKNRRSYI